MLNSLFAHKLERSSACNPPQSPPGEETLRVFDFRSHWQQLTRRPRFHEPVRDGVRAIAILWVLVLHMVFFHLATFPKEGRAILMWTARRGIKAAIPKRAFLR
jgi:hypothetical protein